MARPAYALDVLLGQLNALYPHRSKAADGWIGDAAHQLRVSDHNPDKYGIVRARDFTHDPTDDMGIDCHWLANALVESLDTRIKYIIWNEHIWQWNGWRWHGKGSHTEHLHLSVKAGTIADDRSEWDIGGFMAGLSAAEQRNLYNRVFGIMPQRYYAMRKIDGIFRAVQVDATASDAEPCAVLDTLDGASLAMRMERLENLVKKQTEQIAELRHYVESLQ